MLLKKFRTGLLGRFVKFGILPSVFVIVAVILLNTLFNVNAIQLQATELSRNRIQENGRFKPDFHSGVILL